MSEKGKEVKVIYSFEEVIKASIEYFKGDTMAADVWVKKYALKDMDGNLHEKTPDDMHRRMAKEFARIEKKYPNPMSEEEIYELLKDFKYVVPGGSPMSGIGNDFQTVSLSNCYVIGNEVDCDSYGGIFRLDEELIQLCKRRGGVGLDISFIRPAGDKVHNSALSSTGIVPFMERFSNSTREVAQNSRRGALLQSISIKHPNAEDFIDAKLVEGKIAGANISVKIDDEFMDAVINNKKYTQQFPVDSKHPKITKEIDALLLWKKIIHNSWKSAEPGVFFFDNIIRESIPDCYADLGFRTVSTNPCGELPLCPYDSCRLLCVNLYSYIDNPFSENPVFNMDLFIKHCSYALRLMDDIVDLEIEKIDKIIEKVNSDPEPEDIKCVEKQLWVKIREKCSVGRRTGFGITAEGDMIAGMNFIYGTDEAIKFASDVHKTLKLSAYKESVKLAKERGKFEIYDTSREKDNPFIKRIKEQCKEYKQKNIFPEFHNLYEDMVKYGRRNIALLTIAPTGSLSVLTQTTSGIEPAFLIYYTRRKKINPNDKNVHVDFIDDIGDSWQEFNVFHHKFEVFLKVKGYDIDEVKKMPKEKKDEIIKLSPYYKATANDVDWVKKVEMQGVLQAHIDNSISVTVNLPSDATEELIDKVYRTGYSSKCKGLTVYRDGCRSGVLISKKEARKEKHELEDHSAPKRPKSLDADVVRFVNNKEKWIAVVGVLDKRPYEIFTGKEEAFVIPSSVSKGKVTRVKEKEEDKSRYDFQFEDRDGYKVTIEGLSRSFDKEYWNYAKLISGVLRHGMPLPYVIELVSGLNLSDDSLSTWKNGMIRTIKRYIPDGTKVKSSKCPECGDPNGLIFAEGCISCKSCPFSKCGG